MRLTVGLEIVKNVVVMGYKKEHGAFDCMVQIIETALTYRELAEKRKAMLKKACILLNDHFCGDEHYSSVGEMAEVEKVLEEAQALLKESEAKKDDRKNLQKQIYGYLR